MSECVKYYINLKEKSNNSFKSLKIVQIHYETQIMFFLLIFRVSGQFTQLLKLTTLNLNYTEHTFAR